MNGRRAMLGGRPVIMNGLNELTMHADLDHHQTLREVDYPALFAALAPTRGSQIPAADLPRHESQCLRQKIRDLNSGDSVRPHPRKIQTIDLSPNRKGAS
jgi:hypothetical protein